MANNPPRKWVIVTMLILLVVLWIALVSIITSGWPPDRGYLYRKFNLNYEQQLIILVTISGALGAFIHTCTSFTDYLGAQKFERSWIPWYLMRPFIGATLALAFYFLLRGGLITVNVDSPQVASQYSASQDSVMYIHYDTAHKVSIRSSASSLAGFQKIGEEKLPARGRTAALPINPFGITAISMLAGLFSRQAVDKLKEIFENLFLTRDKVERTDPLVADKDKPVADTGEEEAVG